MTTKYKVPKVRFRGFSEEWEENKLGNKVEFFSGLTYSPNDVIKQNGTLVLRSSNVKNGMIVNADNVYVNPEVVNCDNVQKGDIAVVVRNGSRALIGKHAQIQNEMKNTVIGAFMTGVRSEQPSFLNALLDSSKFNKEIEKNLGATINQITTGAFKKMIFSFPKEAEQTKIGNYFQQLDKLIEQKEKKYQKLKLFKKGSLAKMFPKNGADTPEIRFKGFSGKWEEKRLIDEVDLYRGLTYSPINIVKNGGTLVLRSSNVKDNGLVFEDNVYVKSDVVNSDNVEIGDIIIVVRNGSRSLIGKHAQVKKKMHNTVIGAFMTGMHCKQSSFINSLLDTTKFNKEIEKNLGATINQITNKAFEEMVFMFPSSVEQEKIGNYFQKLDKQIDLQLQEIEKLKNIKKASLDKMFV